jgi:hypothetical protein
MGGEQEAKSGLSKVKNLTVLVPTQGGQRSVVLIKQHTMRIAHAFPKQRFTTPPIFEKFPF